MSGPLGPGSRYVIGPDGGPLTIADLPAPDTKRWVIHRKAQVVVAVRSGLLSLEEAYSRYRLTIRDGPARSGRLTDDPHPKIPDVTAAWLLSSIDIDGRSVVAHPARARLPD